MRICIVGAGRVGQAVAERWAGLGHAIVFGMREPHGEKAHAVLAKLGDAVQARPIGDAAAEAEIVLLAVPFAAAESVIREGGGFAGKILIDCINPLQPNRAGLSIGHDWSAGEAVAAWAPQARVVKALSITGTANMLDPQYPDGPLSMLICGDDADAKDIVTALVGALGFDMVDAGPMAAARLLEPLALLWINLAFRQGYGPHVGFRLLRR